MKTDLKPASPARCRSARLSCRLSQARPRMSSRTHRRPRSRRRLFLLLFVASPCSPPLVGFDVRHVGDAEGLVALHRAVDDVDAVAAQDEIDEACRRTLPAFDLVLTERIDKIGLLGGVKC